MRAGVRFSASYAFLFSLILHGVALLLFQERNFKKETVPSVSSEPIEVYSAPQKKSSIKRQSQIVKSEDAGNSEIDENTNLLGAKNQRAQTDTVATLGDGKIPGMPAEQQAPRETDPEGLGAPRKWQDLSFRDLGVGGAAVADAVNNAQKGERTILSTREYRYYAFYERIRTLAIEQHWRPLLEEVMTSLAQRNRMPRKNELKTSIRMTLDKSGVIQRISVVRSCGFPVVDDVAVQALERGAPFPNPPKGLLEEDESVNIDWNFQVEVVTSQVNVDFGVARKGEREIRDR